MGLYIIMCILYTHVSAKNFLACGTDGCLPIDMSLPYRIYYLCCSWKFLPERFPSVLVQNFWTSELLVFGDKVMQNLIPNKKAVNEHCFSTAQDGSLFSIEGNKEIKERQHCTRNQEI